MRASRIASPLMLIVGLSFWSLAPYGGCSCNNPLGPNSGPTPTPMPTQGPLIDTWEDNDYLNQWGGSATAVKDTYASTMAFGIGAPGSDLGGGTGGRAFRVYGNLDFELAPSKYPYVQVQMGLGGTRNMLSTFSYMQGVRFSYKFATTPIPAGASFFVVAATPSTVTDYAWFRYQIFPANNNWNSVTVYFPNKTGTPKFAQPGWGVVRAWDSGANSGAFLDRIDFAVQPRTVTAYDYDLYIDDVTFF